MTIETKHYKLTMLVLMVTITFDFMSFLLTFPLFPDLFLVHNGLLVAAKATQAMRYFYYALALASWPIGNFFGTAFLGMVSDQWGRKRILMLGLFIVSVAYVVQAYSINIHWFWLFFIARTIQGFFGGNYDVAQAAVADISLPGQKARNMGLIALAGSVGIVFGPIISALTTSTHLVSWFTITTPFWVAAITAFCNVLWISVIFHETYYPQQRQAIRFSKIFTSFMFMLHDKRVIKLTLVYFFLALAWGFYVQQMPTVMQKLFHFSPHQIGLFFVVLGLGFFLAMQYIQPALIKRYELKPIYIVFMLFLTMFILIAAIWPILKVEWVTVFVIAICYVSAYGCLLAITSNAVNDDEQGKVMGGVGAVGCSAFVISALLNAYFSLYDVLIPIFIAALAYFISGMVLTKYRKNR